MPGPNHRVRLQTLPIAPDPWMSGQEAYGSFFFFYFLFSIHSRCIFQHPKATSAAMWWSLTMLWCVMVQHVLQQSKQPQWKQQVDNNSLKSSLLWETPKVVFIKRLTWCSEMWKHLLMSTRRSRRWDAWLARLTHFYVFSELSDNLQWNGVVVCLSIFVKHR